MSEPLGAELEAAASRLRAGEAVVVPTDTVYGLAALARSPEGVAAIFAMKARPERVALPVLVADLPQAHSLAVADGRLDRLAGRFWPGALTVVVRRREGLGLHLGGDETTIGLRCPDAPVVRALADALGPLAVTSANRHGDEPCTTPEQVRATFGSTVALVDRGELGAPVSTVVSLLGPAPELLRAGAIGLEEIVGALGR